MAITCQTTDKDTSFFLCDLDKETSAKIKFTGELRGWWDDHNILIKDPMGNYVLFDVITRKTTTLFTDEIIKQILCSVVQYSRDPGQSRHLSNWNGHDYDFYFMVKAQPRLGTIAFLLKVDRDQPRAQTFSREFQIRLVGGPGADGYPLRL